MLMYLDIETYSPTDLRRSGVYRYAEDPEFDILMTGVVFGDAVPVALVPATDTLTLTDKLLDPEVKKVAHNANFERVCFTYYLRRHGQLKSDEWLDPEQWIDTAAIGATYGLPRSLEKMADSLRW